MPEPHDYGPFGNERYAANNERLTADVLDLAKAIRAQPALWAVFQRVKDTLEMTDEEMGALSTFHLVHFQAQGRRPPMSAGCSSQVLRMLASGAIGSLDDGKALAYLRERCRYF